MIRALVLLVFLFLLYLAFYDGGQNNNYQA